MDPFRAAWKARYREDIYLYAPFAYDAVRVIAAAMREADSVDPAKVTAEPAPDPLRGSPARLPSMRGNLRDPVFTLYQVSQGAGAVIRSMGHSEKN
jgi:branched-chain amino acid transport system substrate-binding protein